MKAAQKKSSVPSTFQARFRAALKGESAREFSIRSNINESVVSRALNGGGVSTKTLAQIALALGVSTDWLLFGRDPMHPEAETVTR